MYEVLKNWLESGNYTIADGQARVDYAVARGKITTTQATELQSIAETNGTPEALTPKSLDERVSDVELAIIDLAGMVAELVGAGETEVEA